MNERDKPPSLDDVKAGRAIIRTPRGFYVPAEVAEKLKAHVQQPDPSKPWQTWPPLLSTPIYVCEPPARWWVRAWRWLTKRRRPGVRQ